MTRVCTSIVSQLVVSARHGAPGAGVTSVLCSYVRSVPAAVSVAEGRQRSAAVRAAASGAAPAPVCPPPTVRPHDDPSQGHAAEGQTWGGTQQHLLTPGDTRRHRVTQSDTE